MNNDEAIDFCKTLKVIILEAGLTTSYSIGFYNGIEYVQSFLENREPKVKENIPCLQKN